MENKNYVLIRLDQTENIDDEILPTVKNLQLNGDDALKIYQQIQQFRKAKGQLWFPQMYLCPVDYHTVDSIVQYLKEETVKVCKLRKQRKKEQIETAKYFANSTDLSCD